MVGEHWMKAWVWLYAPAIAYAALLYWLSDQPTLQHAPSNDKLAHLVAYAGLSGLLFRAFYFGTARPASWVFLLSALLATLYGISDELHQSFVPGRTAAVDDVVADALGALFGAGALQLCYAQLGRWAKTGGPKVRRFTSWALRVTRAP